MALQRPIVVSLSIGAMLAASWFLMCAWLGSLPVISDVSLSLAFRPWWRHWPFAIAIFLMPLLSFAAFRLRYYLRSFRD